MAGATEDALLDDPGIRTDFEHVEIVIRFQNQTIGVAKMDLDELGHVAEVGDNRELGAVGAESESDRIGGVVRNAEGVNLDVTHSEGLSGMDRFDAAEPFAKSIGKNTLHGIHSWLGDVEWGFPKAEHLRQATAVVGVLVGDKDAVEEIDGLSNGGEAGERFAFAESGVNEEAGALRLEQGDVARAARRQDGYPQADQLPPENCRAQARRLQKQIFRMMAERVVGVNGNKCTSPKV